MDNNEKIIALKVAIKKVNSTLIRQINAHNQALASLQKTISSVEKTIPSEDNFKSQIDLIQSQQIHLTQSFVDRLIPIEANLQNIAKLIDNKTIKINRELTNRLDSKIKENNKKQSIEIKSIQNNYAQNIEIINELNNSIENNSIDIERNYEYIKKELVAIVNELTIKDQNIINELDNKYKDLLKKIDDIEIPKSINKDYIYNAISEYISQIKIVRSSTGTNEIAGVTTFLALTDTPSTYSGQAGKFPKVNATEDGLVFDTISGGGDMLASTYDPQGISADAFDVDNHTNGTTNKVFTAVEQTKLSGIEEGADITDSTNVNAAGATMNSDTSLAGNGYFLDQDDMISNDATKVASQQSIKAYVDNNVYTSGDFDTDFTTKSTSDLAEGTNLYYTDTRVDNNTNVLANTASRHDALTVTDSLEINLTLTGQDLTADLITGSIDETKLDTSVNASLDLADSSLQTADIGVNVQAYSAILDATTASYTVVDESKLDYINVTQAVDLDQMETDIAALANGMVYKGDWDASAGSFPGSGNAQTGWFYYVSVAGTVDGVDFAVGDNIVAIIDNASMTTYAGNWSKHDQTDAVRSVAGKVGAVTLVENDITNLGTTIVLDSDIGVNVQAFDAGLTSIAGLTTSANKMIYTTASDTYAVTDLSSFGRDLVDDANASDARTTLGLGAIATLSSIDLTTNVTETLPIANGGTNANSQTTNGVNFFNGTSITSNTDLTFDGSVLESPNVNTLSQLTIGPDPTQQTTFEELTSQYFDIKKESSGTAIMGLTPIPLDGTSPAQFRYFRFTNTTGAVSIIVFRGDNSSVVNSVIGANIDSYLNAVVGDVGIGTNNPKSKLHINGSVRIDQAVTTASVSSNRHIPINVNGTVYKLLLAT